MATVRRPSFTAKSLSSKENEAQILQLGHNCDDSKTEELIKRFKLKEKFLGAELNQTHMLKVSQTLSEWTIFGRRAGLNTAEITAIKHDEGSEVDRRYRVLEKWHQQNPLRATYRNLIKILVSIKRGDIACQVCKFQEDKFYYPETNREAIPEVNAVRSTAGSLQSSTPQMETSQDHIGNRMATKRPSTVGPVHGDHSTMSDHEKITFLAHSPNKSSIPSCSQCTKWQKAIEDIITDPLYCFNPNEEVKYSREGIPERSKGKIHHILSKLNNLLAQSGRGEGHLPDIHTGLQLALQREDNILRESVHQATQRQKQNTEMILNAHEQQLKMLERQQLDIENLTIHIQHLESQFKTKNGSDKSSDVRYSESSRTLNSPKKSSGMRFPNELNQEDVGQEFVCMMTNFNEGSLLSDLQKILGSPHKAEIRLTSLLQVAFADLKRILLDEMHRKLELMFIPQFDLTARKDSANEMIKISTAYRNLLACVNSDSMKKTALIVIGDTIQQLAPELCEAWAQDVKESILGRILDLLWKIINVAPFPMIIGSYSEDPSKVCSSPTLYYHYRGMAYREATFVQLDDKNESNCLIS